MGVWETRTGRLITKLADSPLGAIVTHAEITPDGRFIISSETGKFLIWNRVSEQVIFRDDEPGIQQITFMNYGYKVMIVTCPNNINQKECREGEDSNRLFASTSVRTIPGKSASIHTYIQI